MPYGGPVIEVCPDACPAGHPWGPPVDGAPRVRVGWLHCGCPGASNGGHRTYMCWTPGCPDPWVYVGGHDPEHDGARNYRIR